MKFEKGRLNEVVNIIGGRMMNIGRFNVAAEIFESIGDYESSVDAYIRANMYDWALEVAQNVTPPNMRDKMIKDIQNLKW